MTPGRLYLIPVSLGEDAPLTLIPEETRKIASRLRSFIAEEPKNARRFLKSLGLATPLQEIEFLSLNEHTPSENLPRLILPLLEGKSMGLMSDAGCPAVADPGAELVRLAHEHGVTVVPLPGPSAILLALMASGLNGQRFAFRGYLPAEKASRMAKIRELERDSKARDETEIFIETPYRNQHLFESLLETCRQQTRLCVALDLTLETEFIRTITIAEWSAKPPELGKRPAVFLLYSG
jgi:16S rRNA (cytidine1402-2'-O)-methyltransferase